MDTIIYGAGMRGKKFYDMLKNKGIAVKYFCDIRADEICGLNINDIVVPVINYDRLLELDLCQVVVGIANGSICDEITSKLVNDGVKVVQIEDLLYENCNDIVSNNRHFIKNYHLEEMQDYFMDAENNLNIFWDETSVFAKYFKMLDLTSVVELACGHGRHVNCYKQNADKIILVDILEENIEFCKKRFTN